MTSVKPADNPVLQTIWDIVAMIPHGRVSTYGNVARAAGLAPLHRLVGNFAAAEHNTPNGPGVGHVDAFQ